MIIKYSEDDLDLLNFSDLVKKLNNSDTRYYRPLNKKEVEWLESWKLDRRL